MRIPSFYHDRNPVLATFSYRLSNHGIQLLPGGRNGTPLQDFSGVTVFVGAGLAPARFFHKYRFQDGLEDLMGNLGV